MYNIRYKETSSVVYLLTEKGIVSYKVLGAFRKKSKLLGATIPFCLIDVIITKSKFPTLCSYSIVDNYNVIKEDLFKTIFAESLIDLTKKINDSNYYSQIYNFFIRSINYIKNSNNYYLVLSIYYLKLTRVFGINPTFDTAAFSNDSKSGLLPLKYLKLMESLYNDNDNQLIEKYQENNFKSIFFSIINYYNYLLDFTFSNLKNLKAIEKR